MGPSSIPRIRRAPASECSEHCRLSLDRSGFPGGLLPRGERSVPHDMWWEYGEQVHQDQTAGAWMNLLKLARMADKKLQRWRDAARRRVLINARRPMNYSIVAPVVEAIREDPRVRFYLVASEESERAPDIYRDARPGLEIITALKASSMRFDAYLVSDLLWLALPRGACRILMFHGVAGKYNRVYDSPHRSMREWDRLF